MTEGKEMSPRRIYVLTLAIAVAAASAVCLYHGLRTGKDSVLGLTAQAEKYFGVERAELVLAQKRGDYMAALLRNADGSPFMALYQRDTLFRDRWQAVGGTSSFAPGTMDSWNYGDPKGNAVLIFSGLELPTEAKWYTFTNSGTEYLRPISSDRVLDLFVIGGADDISGVPVLLDENRQELK